MHIRRAAVWLIALQLVGAPSGAQMELAAGTFVAGGNVLRDPDSGLSLGLTPGWRLQRAVRLASHGKTLTLVDGLSKLVVELEIFESPQETPGDMERAMRGAINSRTNARRSEGLQGYRLRENAVESFALGGVAAVKWLADYTENGRPTVEYCARIRARKTTAVFSAHMPNRKLDAFRARFEPMLESLRLPADDARSPRQQVSDDLIRWQPIIWESGRSALLLPARLDGIPGKFTLQLDTGAPNSPLYCDPRILGRSENAVTRNGFAQLSGEIAGCPFFSVFRVSSGNKPSPDKNGNLHIGTLGTEFLRRRILLIDFVRQRIAILPEDTDISANMQSAATFLPISIRGGHIFVPLSINGKVSREFFYDTGASLTALSTTPSRWRESTGRTGEERDNIRNVVNSWGNRVEIVGAPLKGEMRVGPAVLVNPVIEFANSSLPNFDFDKYPAHGLFGNAIFFDRFTVIVDMAGYRFGLLKGSK